MKGRTAGIAAGSLVAVLFGAALFVWNALHQEAVIAEVSQRAAAMASAGLGTKVTVGGFEVGSLRDITVHDIAIYDKQAECIAKAGSAQVHFSLFSLFRDPAAAVSEIVVRDAEATLAQRADGSWNAEDIRLESEGESNFRGTVRLEDSRAVIRRDGQELAVDGIDCELDFGSYPAIRVEAAAEALGTGLELSGTVSGERQILHAEAAHADLARFLPYVPEGTIPEDIELHGGLVPRARADILRRGNKVTFSGGVDYEGIALRVLDTEVEDIHGHATFTESKIFLSADAEAAGQKAHAGGSIRLDTGAPYLDLVAESDSFAPGAVLKDLPVEGAAAFRAHVTGTADRPVVDGEVSAEAMTAYGVPVERLAAHVRYADDAVYVTSLKAGVLDGELSGEAELAARDLSFTAHLKARGLDAARFGDYVPEAAGIAGRLDADLGAHGTGADIAALSVYGSVTAVNGAYRELPVERLDASFQTEGTDVKVDYLSAHLPNRGSVGLEGTILSGRDLDLAFYGGHVDLSLLSRLLPQADMTGLSDFHGTIRGDASNPQVSLGFSGLRGTLFRQPYDTLRASVSGSLDGIGIDSFEMERNAKPVWIVTGTVGLAGERRVDLRVDTVGARMEDIMALVAPDQRLTGNVDNTIRFVGTLDNPQIVGYIELARGSYRLPGSEQRILVSGMKGDYYVEGNRVRLQDFHIYSPMVDMDVNGTIDRVTMALDMAVDVHDINMQRFRHKLPYDASGHGTFQGRISGTVEEPRFDGILNVDELVFNGVSLRDAHGHASYQLGHVLLDEFQFRQGDGSYNVVASLNADTEEVAGRVDVENVDINELCALANQKNELVQGKLTSRILLGGTLSSPTIQAQGEIPQGTLAGYDIHGIALDVNYNQRILFVNRLSGSQGKAGAIDAKGSLSLDGPLAMELAASHLELGLFAKLAGMETVLPGYADIAGKIAGTMESPDAELEITATGKEDPPDEAAEEAAGKGRKKRKERKAPGSGAPFDTVHGAFHLKDGLIDVQEMVVQKEIEGRRYQASARGIVPLRALTATQEEKLESHEQIRLHLALDEANLALLPSLSEYAEWALGDLQGSLDISGTLARPLVLGSVFVPDGSVKFRGVEKPLEKIQLELAFDGERMTVRQGSAQMGSGACTLGGSAGFRGMALADYGFDLFLDKLDIQSSFYRGPFSMDLHLSEGETPYLHRKLPRISGFVDIDNCEISVPQIPESEGELPEILLDVSLRLGDDVHFYSPYLYNMYLTSVAEAGSDGASVVHFGGTTRHPKTSGTVRVKRGGTVNYLKTVFNIREGEAYFNQLGSFLPSVSFYADTKLPQARVSLSLQGPLEAMEFHLTSTPEMSQAEILQLLTLRDAYKKGQTNMEVGDLLTVGLQMTFLSAVEDLMRKVLFLDSFSISRGSGSAFDHHIDESSRDIDVYNVQMGKYLNDKLMLKFTQEIGGENVSRYGIQYDLSDQVGLTLERERNDFIVGVEARMRF